MSKQAKTNSLSDCCGCHKDGKKDSHCGCKDKDTKPHPTNDVPC